MIMFIILGGLLCRIDGWGAENDEASVAWSRWRTALIEYSNAWTCGLCFFLLTFIYTLDPLVSLAAGLAFVAFRLPGFSDWFSWWSMFLRGAWPTLIGFTLLSYAAHGHPYYGWLFLGMGLAEMLAYCVPYNYLLGRLPDWVIHPIAEISSGAAFTAFVCVIIAGV